ncbi:uncharacterized protein GBIM_04423 [Gryllus bimaculatus]|nr:uncharacterized protein GBIM_04423 [Gryllus bimaculatus]
MTNLIFCQWRIEERIQMDHNFLFMVHRSRAGHGEACGGSGAPWLALIMFCCYSTTQPAPHLDGVHVVFGQVISGQEVASNIESLPVDRVCRPLQDAKVVN